VRKQLASLVESLSYDDTFVCYFSGHGWIHRGSLMLLWEDTQLDKLLSTAISARELCDYLKFCKAYDILFVLDCCHAGTIAKMLGLKGSEANRPSHVEDLMSSDSYVILLASGSLEKTRELEMYEGSFLTVNICAALTDSFHLADIDGDSRISTVDLIKWLRKQAREHNRKNPNLRVPLPRIVGQLGEAFLAIREPDRNLFKQIAEAETPFRKEALIRELGLRDVRTSQEEIEERVGALLEYIVDGDSTDLRITAIEALCAVSA
jgi:hypothetical protein